MAFKEPLDTVSSVLLMLKRKGQDNEFTVYHHEWLSLKGKLYRAQETHLVRMYRFEGISDPADQAIIYVVRTKDGTVGYSLDAYGTYTNHNDDGYAELIGKMTMI